MASSDDEVDVHPQSVSNYHFVDERGPVSFAVLPVQWAEPEITDGKEEQVFLDGFVDGGLQKIYLEVIAWKFDLSNIRPEISVLSKDRRWIKLEKPRKSFEDTIRTVLITVHFLHYIKRTPEASSKCVWDHMYRVFSYYEVRPSENDLLNHIPLIREAADRDAVLAKSKLLLMVLDELGNKQPSDMDIRSLAKPAFIVDDAYDDTIDEAAEESDGDDDVFDSVCAFCDNGGILLCCDGPCMRSFHATEEDGEESVCDSLGFNQKEVDEIQNFFCKNCEHNQHQCFACGKLGSSDKLSSVEVFRCNSATCGRFYHPHCVAKLLHREDEHAAKELEKKIAEGDSFTCPIHKCCVCERAENKKIHELQFAVCRRCPKSYHRKCLPRKIAFEDNDDEDTITRAWEGLLPHNRILIYCLKHEIDDELGTPLRDHIKFPNVKSSVRENNATIEENMTPTTKDRVISRKKGLDLDDSFCKRTAPKVVKLTEKLSSGKVGTKKKSEGMISSSNISRKPKANEVSRNRLNENKRPVSKVFDKSDDEEKRVSLGDKLYELMSKGSEQIKPVTPADIAAVSVNGTKKELSNGLPSLDADSERRLLALFKEASSSITLENIIEKHKVASTNAYSSLKTTVEKTITAGKLEGSVDAVRTALRKLEEGCSTEDAEAVCDPDVLKQIFKWKDKLKVYLAPVLNGNRYTSYGRHFTQLDKLEGIVDRLHWYIQNGDMIVDFCCGANDFSILMKKKLEETGKKCSYKNYDLLPTTNDFSFEVRDWLSVQRNELPAGSKLIMGLNPPFGLKAALANMFIDKALEFQPKLLILIVPPETQRLDKKRSPYDLVWEDDKFLSGKSFYLPGSVDVNDKQIEQWNVRAPVLYLWSRPDWTSKHKAVAQEHNHLFNQHEVLQMESIPAEPSPTDDITDDKSGDRVMPNHDLLKSTDDPKDTIGHTHVHEGQKESSHHDNVDQESQEQSKSVSDRKRKHTDKNNGRGQGMESPAKKQAVNEGVPHHSKSSVMDGRSSMEEGFRSNSVMTPQHVEVSDTGHLHFETGYSETLRRPSVAGSLPDYVARNLEQQQQHGSIAASFSDYGARNLEQQQHGSVAGSFSNYGARNLEQQHGRVAGSFPDYGARNLEQQHQHGSVGYRAYMSEEEKYWRELDMRSQVPLYGIQGPNYARGNHIPGHGPMGYNYGQLGSVPEPAYGMRTSVMQRYAPCLDELNHVRMTSHEPPPIPHINTNGHFQHAVPRPAYGGGPLGFAPGPRHSHSPHNSAGWLNE